MCLVFLRWEPVFRGERQEMTCDRETKRYHTIAVRYCLKRKEEFKMKKQVSIMKMVVLSMLVALGVVISPILRVEGMCPMAHLINIVCSVLLGPWYSLLCAAIIGILRMTLMGIPPLALTGAVFGAFLSGVFYRLSKGRLICAVLGEIIGTGLIGAVVSYPVMTYIWGREGLSWVFYIPSFIAGTLIGGSIAYIFLRKLADNGSLAKMQKILGSPVLADNSTPLTTALTIAACGAVAFIFVKVLGGIVGLEGNTSSYIAYGLAGGFALAALIVFTVKKSGGERLGADK